jgi:glycosyltransferase involved in cell wall biosynthesis
MGRSGPLVSVVVPTYNNDDTIETCLSSIATQTYGRVETIVVDNYSTDRTIEIARRFTDAIIRENAARQVARRIGASAATGSYLFHVDSDMELSPTVIEECVDACDADRVDAVVVPERNVGDSFWARVLSIEKALYREAGVGAARFVDHELYSKVGGHNSQLVLAEDFELHDRIVAAGAEVAHIDSHIDHHLGNVGFVEILRNRRYYAKQQPDMVADTHQLDEARIEQERKQFIRLLLAFLRNHPIYTSVFLLITAISTAMRYYYRLTR